MQTSTTKDTETEINEVGSSISTHTFVAFQVSADHYDRLKVVPVQIH